MLLTSHPHTSQQAVEISMPFVLPPSFLESDRLALVTAFGRLSVLEACTVIRRGVTRAEAPTERVAVLTVERPAQRRVTELAGVHK